MVEFFVAQLIDRKSNEKNEKAESMLLKGGGNCASRLHVTLWTIW